MAQLWDPNMVLTGFQKVLHLTKKPLAKLTLVDKSVSAAEDSKQVNIKSTTNPSSKDNSSDKKIIRRAKWLNLYKKLGNINNKCLF